MAGSIPSDINFCTCQRQCQRAVNELCWCFQSRSFHLHAVMLEGQAVGDVQADVQLPYPATVVTQMYHFFRMLYSLLKRVSPLYHVPHELDLLRSCGVQYDINQDQRFPKLFVRIQAPTAAACRSMPQHAAAPDSGSCWWGF